MNSYCDNIHEEKKMKKRNNLVSTDLCIWAPLGDSHVAIDLPCDLPLF